MKVWQFALIPVGIGALCWGIAAIDYSENVIPGTYHFHQGEDRCMLVVRSDHTFHQDLMHKDHSESADGTWEHEGEGGIGFSKQFLTVMGEEQEPDGTAFAEIHKTLGIFIKLEMRNYHVLWFGKEDASSTGVEGTYKGDEPGVTAILTLKVDSTFEQTLGQGPSSRHAVGTWIKKPSGDISFSRTFLKTSGDPLQEDETATTAGGGGPDLQIEIARNNSSGLAVFRKWTPSW
jgi:hypothetical protein